MCAKNGFETISAWFGTPGVVDKLTFGYKKLACAFMTMCLKPGTGSHVDI